MPPRHLHKLIETNGKLEKQTAGQVFHAQDFAGTMFMIKSGYVKRNQITKDNNRVIELIYGPGHLFPLTQLYRKIFSVQPNQEHLVYVYQAMTDVEIWRIADTIIEEALQDDPKLYIDLYHESGLRLKSNIDRLASNALNGNDEKVAHQLVCLADDFGSVATDKGAEYTKIEVPLSATDIAEQLNISIDVTSTILDDLVDRNVIKVMGEQITIIDIDRLKDAYL